LKSRTMLATYFGFRGTAAPRRIAQPDGVRHCRRPALDQIEVIALEQFAQIARTAVTLASGSKAFGTPSLEAVSGISCIRPARLAGERVRVEAALGSDDAVQEVGVEAIPVAGIGHGLMNIHGAGGVSLRSASWGPLRLAAVRVQGSSPARSDQSPPWYIDVAGFIGRTRVEARVCPDQDAAFVADRKTVAQNRNLGGRCRCGDQAKQ